MEKTKQYHILHTNEIVRKIFVAVIVSQWKKKLTSHSHVFFVRWNIVFYGIFLMWSAFLVNFITDIQINLVTSIWACVQCAHTFFYPSNQLKILSNESTHLFIFFDYYAIEENLKNKNRTAISSIACEISAVFANVHNQFLLILWNKLCMDHACPSMSTLTKATAT